jgi:excisionase family DNA binding protein
MIGDTNNPKYMTASELADHWRVHRKTIEKWVRTGELGHVRLGGSNGPLRFSAHHLREFEHRKSTTPLVSEAQTKEHSFRARIRQQRQGENNGKETN